MKNKIVGIATKDSKYDEKTGEYISEIQLIASDVQFSGPDGKIHSMLLDADSRLEIIENMFKYDGSFVKALGELTLRADNNNLKKLIDTFSDYYMEYLPEKWSR